MTHVLVEVPQGLCFFAASGFGCVCGYIDRGWDAKRNFWRAEEASDNRWNDCGSNNCIVHGWDINRPGQLHNLLNREQFKAICESAGRHHPDVTLATSSRDLWSFWWYHSALWRSDCVSRAPWECHGLLWVLWFQVPWTEGCCWFLTRGKWISLLGFLPKKVLYGLWVVIQRLLHWSKEYNFLRLCCQSVSIRFGGICDVLQVTSRKDQAQYWADRQQAYRYVSVADFSEAFKRFYTGSQMFQELSVPYPKERSHKAALATETYAISTMELFKANFAKEVLLMKRNYFIYVFKTLQAGVVVTQFCGCCRVFFIWLSLKCATCLLEIYL